MKESFLEIGEREGGKVWRGTLNWLIYELVLPDEQFIDPGGFCYMGRILRVDKLNRGSIKGISTMAMYAVFVSIRYNV